MLRNTPMAPAGRAGKGGSGRAPAFDYYFYFIIVIIIILYFFFLYAAEMDAPKQSAVFAVAQELIGNDTLAYQ